MAAPAPTTAEVRSILMRANRLLGASLVDSNLITVDQLESANEKLLELIASALPRQCTLLGVLAYDLKVITERDVLQYCMDEHRIGLIDLKVYEGADDLRLSVNQPACWATWTLPFDREEDFTLIATAYYLSPAVRAYWERQFPGPILWYGTTLEGIAEALERLPAPRA
jgi:hypothetical protein